MRIEKSVPFYSAVAFKKAAQSVTQLAVELPFERKQQYSVCILRSLSIHTVFCEGFVFGSVLHIRLFLV